MPPTTSCGALCCGSETCKCKKTTWPTLSPRWKRSWRPWNSNARRWKGATPLSATLIVHITLITLTTLTTLAGNRERDKLAKLYAELDAAFLSLTVEKDELQHLSWALGNETLVLEAQRLVLEQEGNALERERDALEVERDTLQVDKALLEHEQALLEMAKRAVEVERDDYLTRWVAVTTLVVMIVNMLLLVGYVVCKGRKKQRDAYHDFKQNLVCVVVNPHLRPLTLTFHHPHHHFLRLCCSVCLCFLRLVLSPFFQRKKCLVCFSPPSFLS